MTIRKPGEIAESVYSTIAESTLLDEDGRDKAIITQASTLAVRAYREDQAETIDNLRSAVQLVSRWSFDVGVTDATTDSEARLRRAQQRASDALATAIKLIDSLRG